MADSAVNLGMGGSSREGLGEFLDYLRTNRPVYKEGDERPYKYYSDDLMVPEQKSSTFAQRYEFTADRASPYAGMANSLYDMEAEDMLPLLEDGSITSNSIYGKSGSNVPSYVEISPDGSFTETPIGFDDGGEVDPLAGVSNDDKRRILRIGNNNVADLVDNDYKIYTILTDRQKKGQRNFAEFEEGGIVDLPTELSSESADRGIGGLLMYEDMADPLYPARPIEKQSFGKNRGFQHGQMVKLGERDDAVGGKLLKQAGIMASANQVLDNLDPKVLSQMSRILGRDLG